MYSNESPFLCEKIAQSHMLISYSVKNYRSIADKQVLSFAPANRQKEFPKNILSEGDTNALNAIAIYGANASGKSNIINGLSSFLSFLRHSSSEASIAGLDYQPFLLRKGYENLPTMMELVFVIESRRYRYGFEYDNVEVKSEWLFKKDTGRESPLFEREGDTIETSLPLSPNKKLVDLAIDATRPNALFLSMCDTLNIEEAKKIIAYLANMTLLKGNSYFHPRMGLARDIRYWENSSYASKLQGLISRMDVGIKEVVIERKEEREGGYLSMFSYDIKTKHTRYDENGKATSDMATFEMSWQESSGTQQVFRLSAPVVKTLFSGGILVIDEIESKLHPVMTLGLIDLFMDPESNPKKAQLLFTTHDTNLLTYSDLRRDQIYFMEKNSWEGSELFSLSDFVYYGEKDGQIIPEKERIDTDKEKRYIEGRYGAIPMLGEFKSYVKSLWLNEEKLTEE